MADPAMLSFKRTYIDIEPPQELIDMLLPSYHSMMKDKEGNPLEGKALEEAHRNFMPQVVLRIMVQVLVSWNQRKLVKLWSN